MRETIAKADPKSDLDIIGMTTPGSFAPSSRWLMLS
jgi:hypothetical protein